MEPAEDDWIVAECPALPGCVSQGRDEEEAMKNIKEAITAWMWAEEPEGDAEPARKSGFSACSCLARDTSLTHGHIGQHLR